MYVITHIDQEFLDDIQFNSQKFHTSINQIRALLHRIENTQKGHSSRNL